MDIFTHRLRLWPMSESFLAASLAGDSAALVAELGAAVDPEWLAERDLMEIRLGDLRSDPAARPWLLRAIVLRETNTMVGHIGCHAPPVRDDLAIICPGEVEFGYTVFPAYRRRGFAREATLGLLNWAKSEHAIGTFIASASPHNEPSVRLLESLGFIWCGSHIDEVDGYEDIYRLVVSGQ